MIDSGPKLSFITPTYNASRTIGDTIRSVEREARHFKYEHRFVDGGSSDDTVAIIRQLKDRDALVTSEADNGPYDAMNKGIREARGEWIAIINADDCYLPGAVETMMAAADAFPSARILHGDMIVDFGDSKLRVKPGRGLRGRLGLEHPISHPAMFAKAELYGRHGLYNAQYRLAADQDFFFRILDEFERIKYIPEAITMMRSGGLSGRYYDDGTLELLCIHRSRKNVIGLVAQLLFYKASRLRNHPNVPRDRWAYYTWALRDLIRRTSVET